MKHLIISFFLILMPNWVRAVTVDGITYALHGTEASVWNTNSNTAAQSAYSGDIIIPPSFTYNGVEYTVTSIGEGAFYRSSRLTSIEIPNTVTSIGKRAFRDCDGLNSLTIPNSVTSIDDEAFMECNNLMSVEIPNSVTNIGKGAFSYTGLMSIEIPNSVSSIESRTFWECERLLSIEIPNSVTNIGEEAFDRCHDLRNVKIPNSVISIGSHAFGSCTHLTSIEIPNSVTSIGSGAFYGCSGLMSVEIPNSITSIEGFTFYNCTDLRSVDIPNSVISFGENSFSGCSKLTEIHWTPNPNANFSQAMFTAASFTNTSRTLYLYKNSENAEQVDNLKTQYNSKFKEIIVVVDNGCYSLNVSDAGMSTLYLDYAVKIPNDDNLLYICYVDHIDNQVMHLKKLNDYIPANTGVIIMANPGEFTFKSTAKTVRPISDNMLSGVTENTPASSIDGTVYTLGHGKNSGLMGFYKYTGATLAANKAFLVRNTGSSVNSFNMVIDNEDGTTNSIGRIDDGEFLESNVVYDLQGRRVERPAKGIYIMNGKKVLFK